MTSQQAAAIVAAAGVGGDYPTITTSTSEEYQRAIRVLLAAGFTAEHSTYDRPTRSGGVIDMTDFRSENGVVTVCSPIRHDDPIARLAEGTLVSEAADAPCQGCGDHCGQCDRYTITEAGRAHLRVLDGGAA